MNVPQIVLVVALVFMAVRVGARVRRSRTNPTTPRARRPVVVTSLLGDTGLVAAREVRARVRGRVFRIGTGLILLGVAAAIVIPAVRSSKSRPERVGVVGALTDPQRAAVVSAATGIGTKAAFVPETDSVAADADLHAGRVDVIIVNGTELIVKQAITTGSTSATARLVRAVSASLGVEQAVTAAGLSAAQAHALAGAKPLRVTSLQPAKGNGTTRTTSVIGVVVVFMMLTQYNTWTLIGVMEEKSSRVVEVLLAAVGPVELLRGKVLGIGLVALGQAALIVAFALGVAKAVGSDILHGTAPLVLLSSLLWLVLGYAFYCWVYAAAGSMAERQDQAQSLAIPLSVPAIFGYVVALSVSTSGNLSLFVKVLAYLPPTAPFLMPVLVGLETVTWWQFAVSVALSIAGTVVVARVAVVVYRRAILRTGRRVRLREVLSQVG